MQQIFLSFSCCVACGGVAMDLREWKSSFSHLHACQNLIPSDSHFSHWVRHFSFFLGGRIDFFYEMGIIWIEWTKGNVNEICDIFCAAMCHPLGRSFPTTQKKTCSSQAELFVRLFNAMHGLPCMRCWNVGKFSEIFRQLSHRKYPKSRALTEYRLF